jgi:protein DGCR14
MSQIVSTSTPTPQARSLNSQVVLDEDEYTEALSKIIARDFFPSLAHLDATNNYLGTPSADHLADGTPVANQSGAPRHLVTPTPVGLGVADTPFSRRDELSQKSVRYNTSLSLDDFQARYTSEDNSSFTQILDDENRKRKERWAWAWAAQRRVEGQKAKELEGRERMLIEAPGAAGVRETFMPEAPATVKLITDTPEKEQSQEVVKVPANSEDIAEVDVMAPKKDTRSTRVDAWNFKVIQLRSPSPQRV